MKLKNNFTLTGLGGEYIAVPLDGNDDFHGIVKLNKSGAEVFQFLRDGMTKEQAVQALMEKYAGLDRVTAEKAVTLVIEKLSAAGLLEE